MFGAELVANDSFYKAFNTQNLNLMKEVWLENISVICIHPGWPPLKGYEHVIESWGNIFRNSDNLEIKLSNVEMISSSELTWVNCQENLFSITTTGVQTSKVHATNLFKQVRSQWKMVLHHASAIPGLTFENTKQN